MKIFSLLAMTLMVLATVSEAGRKTKPSGSHKPIVYLIRHGEKPANDGVGLNPSGEKRAQCIRKVFGAKSQYNIGYILAQKFKASMFFYPTLSPFSSVFVFILSLWMDLFKC